MPTLPLVETGSEVEGNGVPCICVQLLLYLSPVSQQFGLYAVIAAVPAVQGEAP